MFHSIFSIFKDLKSGVGVLCVYVCVWGGGGGGAAGRYLLIGTSRHLHFTL